MNIKLMGKLSSIILLTTLIIPCILASKQCDFPAVFNLGDSNSDTGGLSAAFRAFPPPNGETFFHHPAGRVSDGRLIIDFIAQSAALPYLHAYLDSIAPNFKHGVNFATAGATITTTNTTLSQSWVSPISLNVQILEYYQFRTRSQLPTNPVFKSLLPKKEYFYQGLYTFDIGQNDLGAAYFSGMTTDEVIAAVPDIINHFGQIVKDIYWQGGRSFWIHNTGPIGCLPYLLERYPVGTIELDRYGCGRTFNLGAQYFNEKLKEVVVQLRKDLPLAALTYVDIYSVKYNLITHAKKYGFKNPFVACCGQLALKQCDFPAVFNFGDSNSDTGGFSATFGPAFPPNGETFFHHPAGRYSDGRLIVDFIAQSVGLPYLHAYLDSIAPNFAHGANFATAGSTIRTQNTTLFQSGFSPISLNVQFWEFSQFRTRSQLPTNPVFKNLLPKEEYFSQGLYTFDIGQNDLTAAYFSGMTTAEVIAAVPDIVNHFSKVVKDIYRQGGRSFWIHNTAPIGCLPYVLERLPLRTPEVDRYGCGSPFNSAAQHFNEILKELVVQLRKDLPLAALTYVDIYSVKYNLITHAKKYGFEHPLVACRGHGGKEAQ
ncbi:hypothetical protein AAC387_Pa02g3831 [Persea americana]